MNHIFRTNALDGMVPERALPPGSRWRLFAVQLSLLAAFVGMNLVAIAVIRCFEPGTVHGAGSIVARVVAGAALSWVAWRTVVRMLHRDDRKPKPADTTDRRSAAWRLVSHRG